MATAEMTTAELTTAQERSADRPAVGVTIAHVAERANDVWENSSRGRSISVVSRPVIDPHAAVFAMGSCFAVEIRKALRERGFRVLPAYLDLEIDLEHVRVGRLPERDNVNHYDTFSIRHDVEQAFGRREGPTAGDFWRIDSPEVRASVGLKGEHLFQNPYRKRMFADSPERLEAASRAVDESIREGILSADVFILTLGMIETWREKATGRYLCRRPDADRMDDCEFVLSDFAANLENLRAVCSSIARHRPGTPVILTVSPVSIARTYTDNDIVVANTETKSLLRAVAGQIDREFDDVIYWPSYEIALREDVFAEDGRHLTPKAVRTIVDAFLRAHCAR